MKVLANKLKPLILGLISIEQTGFVEGRQILDGIILTHEMIHSLKQTKTLGMLLMVDLAIAYDKVNWRFLKEILLAYGFKHDWVKWIGNLVSMRFFSILVNNSLLATFQASRGLRQGDPLSLFLFILLNKGLGRTLKAHQNQGEIKGIDPHEGMMPQTHQQFEDDTMLMGVASVWEAKAIKNILDSFKQANGLEINKCKSNLYFFNTKSKTRRNINRILGFIEGTFPSKYLGVLLLEEKST